MRWVTKSGLTLGLAFTTAYACAEIITTPHVSAGAFTSVGVHDDGTVEIVGTININYPYDAVQVSAGSDDARMYLMRDGTVYCGGGHWIEDGQYQTWFGWADAEYVQISMGSLIALGLRENGTVRAIGLAVGEHEAENWTDIVQVSAGTNHALGLKTDGTVVATGDGSAGERDLESWKDEDIVQVSAGYMTSVGLKSNGTVLITGALEGLADVSSWTDIVQVSAGPGHLLGLKSNGTVVATGDNSYGQCDVESWSNIVQVSAGTAWFDEHWGYGGIHSLGLKADGTVVAVGNNSAGQCNVDSWVLRSVTIFDLIDLIITMNLNQGISNSLDAKLSNAMQAVDRANGGDITNAINMLYAFVNETEAQRGKKLTNEQADSLISMAYEVIDGLTQ